MSRPPSFERDQVARAARTVFWQRGYEAASIPELEEATGLGRSSIYNAFGSKKGLFDAAVESYLDEVIRPRLLPLREEVVAPGALATYLEGLDQILARADSMPRANGCLLINAAGAPISRDSGMAEVIVRYRDELQAAVTRGVCAALVDVPRARAQRLAETITALVVAALAVVRVTPGQARHTVSLAAALLAEARADAARERRG